MEDKFISSSIINNTVYSNPDYYKYVGYKADFCDGNFENNLDTTIIDKNSKGDYIHSGYIYSDINNK